MNIELHNVTARMLEIERENMAYNKATNFGQFPNGQEAHIEAILAEWDILHARRNELKYGHKYGPKTEVVYLPSCEPDYRFPY